MEITIVGGGIAGLILALTLHKHSVKCTIYELRETADIANPGAIGLAPNALRPLSKLGLYEQLCAVGWPLRAFQFRNECDELLSTVPCGGSERYGYDTIRIVRRKLHDMLLAAAQAAGIEIISGKKFSHIVSATSNDITFAFTDSTQVTTNVLVGADGIHSTVRKTIDPDIQPEYKGSLALAARLPYNPWKSSPQFQSRIHSVPITLGTNAAFLAIVQSVDGEEITMSLDRPYPDQSREKWDALLDDRQRQYDMMVEDREKWPEAVQVLMDAAKPENMYRSWPFYAIPELKEWSTSDRKLILVGDAAHAVPPSAGQGACMAVEDAWSLGVVLASCHTDRLNVDSDSFRSRIQDWQTERIDRVARMRTLTKQMGNSRLPQAMKDKLDPSDYFVAGKEPDLSWLYSYDFAISAAA